MNKLTGLQSFILRNKLSIILVVWFGVMWSWPLTSQATSITTSPILGYILAFIVVAANVSISVTIFLCAFAYIDKVFAKRSQAISLLISVIVLAFADFAVAWLTSAIWIGPGSKIDNILPLGSPSLILINTPLGFASRIIGFYGLATIFWLSVYLLLRSKFRLLSVIVLIAIGISVGGLAIWKSADGQNIDAIITSEYITEKNPAIQASSADLVVFPEYGLDNIESQNLSTRLVSTDKTTYFVGSAGYRSIDGQKGHYNTLLFGNTKDGITDRQDKYRLIPGGENLPYIGRVVLTSFGQTHQIGLLDQSRKVIANYSPLQNFVASDGIVIGAAVCSSILSPTDYRQFSDQGATILTNSASLSIFAGSKLFAWQQQSLGRFMAVSNARPFLQSANASTGYAIDHNGNKIDQTGPISYKTLSIQTNSRKTIYTHLGEIMAITGGLYLLINFCTYQVGHLRNRNNNPKQQIHKN